MYSEPNAVYCCTVFSMYHNQFIGNHWSTTYCHCFALDKRNPCELNKINIFLVLFLMRSSFVTFSSCTSLSYFISYGIACYRFRIQFAMLISIIDVSCFARLKVCMNCTWDIYQLDTWYVIYVPVTVTVTWQYPFLSHCALIMIPI